MYLHLEKGRAGSLILTLTKNKGFVERILRCLRKGCQLRICKPEVAYTPLHHTSRGSKSPTASRRINCKMLLKAIYLFAVKVPQDAAQHILGSSYKSTSALWRMLRVGVAYAELMSGRSEIMVDGTVEWDATKTNTMRSA